MVKAAIFGGSGYGGSELLRILLFHPEARVAFVSSRHHAGKAVAAVHRNLRHLTDLSFAPPDLDAVPADTDCFFLALEHGEATKLVPRLRERFPRAGVVDLSGDFRVKDGAAFEAAYGFAHAADGLARDFVYGLPEQFGAEVDGARLVANPGCFATGALLAVLPALAARLPVARVLVDGVTGSSGSGATPGEKTHHPFRHSSFFAYKVLSHQHQPEIEQAAARAGGGAAPPIHFVPHSAPLVRGIFTTAFLCFERDVPAEAVRAAYRAAYEKAFFVRTVDDTPNVRDVAGTNFCDIAIHPKGDVAVVLTAIDNLVKGAAGQAVQNMNRMFGLPEETGLRLPGLNP